MLQPARFGSKNVYDVAQLALNWLEEQGAGVFDHNSGRKCLAAWCRHLNVPYEVSVHIHADLPDVWNHHYEKNVVEPDKKLIIRKQSTDPQVATAALRAFAGFCGRGHANPYRPPMTLVERQNDALIRNQSGDAEADAILRGEAPTPTRKRKRRTDAPVRKIRLRPIGRGLKFKVVEMS